MQTYECYKDEYGITSGSKYLKMRIRWFFFILWKKVSNEDLEWSIGVGKRLIVWTIVRKAWSQKLRGRCGWTRRVSPTSIIWRCLRLERPFCSWIWRHEAWWRMPHDWRKVWKALNSPPPLVSKRLIDVPSCSSTIV